MTLRYVNKYFFQVSTLVLLILQLVPSCVGIDARVSLNVEGTGFHRNFVYHVEFRELDKDDCHAAIYFELPSSLYVNVDELADLRRLGVSTVCSVGETDVELFMEKAVPQNVTACAAVVSNVSVLKLPVHQRYQYAKAGGNYVRVRFPKPKLLMGCKHRIKEHRVAKIDLCSPCVDLVPKWRQIPYTMEGEEDYVWLVPVGDSSLQTTITYITLFCTILGAIFITRTIWRSSSVEHQKRD